MIYIMFPLAKLVCSDIYNYNSYLTFFMDFEGSRSNRPHTFILLGFGEHRQGQKQSHCRPLCLDYFIKTYIN